jgi:hypothetical protein
MILAAAGTNTSVHSTCAPMTNDQMAPNSIVPPVLPFGTIPCP